MRHLSLCFAALACAAAHSQAVPDPVAGHKFATPPVIDGTIDEAAEWKDIQKFSGLFDEDTSGAAPESGEFWLAYDDAYIYFAARLADSQPGSIAATEYRTNVGLSGDDSVSLLLDPVGKLNDFSFFEMNPRGATNMSISGGTAAKREWSGDFVAKGRITDKGWEVEARIPWQVMRLPQSGVRELRFNVGRYHKRLDRDFQWSITSGGKTENFGKWQNVTIPEQKKERTLKLLPYAYLGSAEDEQFIFNSGLDLKTPISDQIEMVGTINPDFRNIENQILSLDFSRFERLARDSRPFFQEGSQYIGNALFASQRIQQFDAGINIFGKINDRTSFGILNTTRFEDAKENDLVASGSYKINADSSFRASYTNLNRDIGGIKNEAYLVRYSSNFGPYGIFLRNMGTDDSIVGKGTENVVNAFWNLNGAHAFASWATASPDFRPRLGFFPEVDYKGWEVGGGLNRPVDKGLVAEYGFFASTSDYMHFDGGDYRDSINGSFDVALRSGPAFSVFGDHSTFEGVKDKLYSASIRKPRNDPYRSWNISYSWGELAEQKYSSIGAGISYRPVEKLQLNLSGQFQDHFSFDRQIILGWNYDLGNDKSLSGRAVQSGEDINAYVALRRSGNAGTEYFLILGDPNSLTFKKSLILKITYPLEILLGK